MVRSPRAPTGAGSNCRPPTISSDESAATGGLYPGGLCIHARVRHGWRSTGQSHETETRRGPCSCERLVSHRYLSGTSSLGIFPSAATLAHSSILSLPVTPWCAGAHGQWTITSLSLSRIREQTSMATKRWPGPMSSVGILSMAAVEPTKTVYRWPLSYR